MTTEAKVGAFTLLGIVLLVAVLLQLQGFSFSTSRNYTIYVGFEQVIGLAPEADVRYAGVLAGKVKAIEPEGTGVRVTLSIHPEIQIPRDARISLAANSVLGDKFVLISPAGSKSTDYLKEGDFVIATEEASVDSVLANVNEAIRDVTAVLGRVALQNEGNMHAMMQEMRMILANLSATTETVRQMAADVSDGGATAANLRLTLLNVAKASENIRLVAEEMHDVTGDPTVREDLKATIHQARAVTEKANETLDGFRSIEAKPSVEVLYSGKESDWITNFNVDISKESKPDRFLRVGIEDIGGEDGLNLEVGRTKGSLGARAGLIAGDPGIGIDAEVGRRWRLSADAYDPDDFRLRVSALYRLRDDTYLMGQLRDLNRSERRAAYFGLHQSF